ncbi:MAG: (2Fe-2S) ferredoxin domain-containing protein [Negativicutes bacterium]|nr:(2Fe-2S) ferredoxin domain-containing protein [Negativicutes bacterium]
MKSLEDLKKLREKLQAGNAVRQGGSTQIIVGMGTCGIAAGAREALNAIMDEIAKRKLRDVVVRQTGCIGMCEKEPLVDVVREGEARITYGHVTPEVARKIVAEHVVNDRIVDENVVAKLTD